MTDAPQVPCNGFRTWCNSLHRIGDASFHRGPVRGVHSKLGSAADEVRHVHAAAEPLQRVDEEGDRVA